MTLKVDFLAFRLLILAIYLLLFLCSKSYLLLQPLRLYTKNKKMLYTVARRTNQKAKYVAIIFAHS